jgi:tetratricopeptide (TPR) repeat protein
LFDDAARWPVAQLDSQARYLLGGMAVENNQPAAAARFWQGLSAPPTLEPDEWRIRLAQVLVRAGIAGPGADLLRALIAGRKTLPAGVLQRAVASVQELQDTGFYKSADELYRALLPLAEARERREILFGLGRIAESFNDFQAAADYFLEAALLGDVRATDTFAINARLAAAVNLGRAGLKDDARTQLDWLRKNVKDPEKLELVRREMQKL